MTAPTNAPAQEARQIARRLGRVRSVLLPAALLLLGVLLVVATHDLFKKISYAEIVAAIHLTPAISIWLALAATALSYASLMGYDLSGLEYAGARVPGRIVAATSFAAYALGNTIGLGVLTGGAVRYRMYTAAGVEPSRIARAIAFNAVAFGFGIVTVGAAGLLWGATEAAALLRAPSVLLQGIAVTILLASTAFLLLCASRRELAIGGRRLELPAWPLALRQLALSALDIAASAAVLWFLLPTANLHFGSFVGFYALAVALGVVSHVPGGLGVFEAVMLLAVGGEVPTETLAGALILYRGLYFLLPLALAVLLLATFELRKGTAVPYVRAAARLSPLFLAALTFITGLLLMLSGVTPASREAERLLSSHVPLPLVEAAHFVGSVAGLMLLFVARGLLSRLDAAWWAATGMTALLILLALPKGIAIGEVAVLGFLLTVLLLTRREFDRRASLFDQHFPAGWWIALGCVVAGLTWILFFVYRDVAYAHELWWQFEFDGHAPRSLRALMAIVLLGLGFGAWQLLRPASGRLPPVSAADVEMAAAIVAAQSSCAACLALLGDKHFLFADSRAAFVMYGKRRRSWIGLFDPVGPQREWPELIWRFIELADRHGGRAAFYQVKPSSLPLYLDAGLRAYKLGEYAWLPLEKFSLKGSHRANLRGGHNRGEREGLRFEIVDAGRVPPLLPELEQVSTGWLALHKTREKGFSLGAFAPGYLVRHDVALVWHQGHLVAFATLMKTAALDEVSIDLMRHVPDAPAGTMDFLFVRLILHYQSLGYGRFDLGMAPLAGMATHRLAPRWHRLGRLLFTRGENFYHFRGLRAFKEKFSPEWEARYLVAPGGLAPLLILADIASLISEGQPGQS